MELPIVTVDAFADGPFTGNPAAVSVLHRWPDTALLQHIAAEMNLSETAFAMRRTDGDWDLRWLTPTTEVDLCGHATLATAHHLFEREETADELRFHTRSGVLVARRWKDAIELDFPATPAVDEVPPPGLAEALGVTAIRTAKKSPFDWLVELADAGEVRAARPDFAALLRIPGRGVALTAASDTPRFDFVSRFFAPAVGVDEDPVTGSVHCALVPFWAARLSKTELTAYQASARGGVLDCALAGERVLLRGRGITMLRGTLRVA
jgi:predicted PhzF superfamily epimerase YddE/YHI9